MAPIPRLRQETDWCFSFFFKEVLVSVPSRVLVVAKVDVDISKNTVATFRVAKR